MGSRSTLRRKKPDAVGACRMQTYTENSVKLEVHSHKHNSTSPHFVHATEKRAQMKGAASVLAAGAARAAGRRTALTRTNALSSRSLMRTAVAPSITTAANASDRLRTQGLGL